jgi:zinc/manganese transport system substrate-binding protein
VPSAAQAKVNIFACEPEWAALAKELTGDAATITTAAGGQQDPAKVMVSDKLVAAIRKANLVFCSGEGMESSWLPALLAKTPNPSIKTGNSGNLMAADYVIPLDLPTGFIADTGSNDADATENVGGNPHVHLNPHNIMLVAEELQKRLSEIDPDNRALYDKRYSAFFDHWQDAMDRWEQQSAGLFGLTVATEDDSFAYLVDWLGLVNVGRVEADGPHPTDAQLKTLARKIKKRSVRVILRTPFDSNSATKRLADETGARILVLPYTVGGDKDSGDLFALFDRTLSLLENLTS